MLFTVHKESCHNKFTVGRVTAIHILKVIDEKTSMLQYTMCRVKTEEIKVQMLFIHRGYCQLDRRKMSSL